MTDVRSTELFLAILALDSYNRGYEARLEMSGDKIGTATLGRGTENEDADAKNAGFYGQSYSWNGKTVISYRGTDEPSGTAQSGGDVLHGWSLALGFPISSQYGQALKFYSQVTEQSVFDGRQSNTILTGHSLGGGLAQMIGALSGTDATLFDHAPFQIAAGLAYLSEVTRRGFDIATGGSSNWPSTPSFSHLNAAYVIGEALHFGRILGPALEIGLVTAALGPVVGALLGGHVVGVDAAIKYHAIPSNGGVRSPVDLHSQALLVCLLYAEREVEGGALSSEWKKLAAPLLDSMFNGGLAKAAGFTDRARRGQSPISNKRAQLRAVQQDR